ncbi:MAG: isoprenyl transferase [Alphaproteobacteria bacterium]|nr:isoprenyl transferase [Alphaproteobacteria bacterium]
MANALEHIAIIMDGNGRWAVKRNLPRTAGHKKGAEVVMDIAKAAKNIGVKYLTIYAFSTENWKRPQSEVNALMNLLRQYLSRDFEKLDKENIRIRFIGERDMLADDIVSKMNELENLTKNNTAATLVIALSYGSRAEIVHGVRALGMKIKKGEISPEDVDEKTISDALYTKDIPDPDILIRTSGEQRLSNYLLWQLAYAEFFFTPTLWPDFTATELKQIMETYQTRKRRYGKIEEE